MTSFTVVNIDCNNYEWNISIIVYQGLYGSICEWNEIYMNDARTHYVQDCHGKVSIFYVLNSDCSQNNFFIDLFIPV